MRSPRLENRWVGVMDSPRWRRLRSTPAVERLLSGQLFRRLDTKRRRLLAGLEVARHPDLFTQVETVCVFIGHVKSGGTLLGAMIDAHPDALVADEVDVLSRLEDGFGRREIFEVLAKNSRREAMKGRVTARRLGGYSLAIPDQWQGRHRVVRVIGASRAGPTTRLIGDRPDRLDELRGFASPARLRFIHVVRNPLDPIAAMVLRGGRSVEDATADYARQAERAEQLRAKLSPDEYHTAHYEAMLADPAATVESVVEFLGLEQRPEHVAACAALVDPGRPGERGAVEWSPAQLEAVRDIVESHAFLADYRDHIDVGVPSVEP